MANDTDMNVRMQHAREQRRDKYLALVPGRSKELPQGLVHRCDAGPSTEEGESILPLKGILCLHIELNMPETNLAS